MNKTEQIAILYKELETCLKELNQNRNILEEHKNTLKECKNDLEREMIENCMEYFRLNVERMKTRINEIEEEINSK